MPGIVIANTVGSYGAPIWGDPGKFWHNQTNLIHYQFHCAWANTCGRCAQYDGAVRPGSWGIPEHRGCNCRQTPITPGQHAPEPFTDFRATIDGLDQAQKRECIGASNYRLLQAGVVKLEDIVTPYRVRDLREVVAIMKLSVQQMETVGIRTPIAQQAFLSVHTPAHHLAAQARTRLVANLQGAGLATSQIATLAARGIAGRVQISSGPSGPSRPIGGGLDLVLLRSFLALPIQTQRAAMKQVKPAAQPPPAAKSEPSWKPGDTPIDVSLPIDERIKRATHLDERVKTLADLQDQYDALKDRKYAVHLRIMQIQDEIGAGTLDAMKGMRELSKLEKEQLKLDSLMTDTANLQRTAARKITRLPEGAKEVTWDHKAIDSQPAAIQMQLKSARNWMEGRVAGDHPVEINWNTAPPDKAYRANADPANKKINLDQRDTAYVVVHEWGHHLEFSVPGVHQAAKDFLAYRTKGQQPRYLTDVIPDGKYDAHEQGRDDDFAKAFGKNSAWYVGKVYPTWTEITSMGMQELYLSPLQFAKKDPEYCKFILGLLDGSLRRP
jgi:hypothetical protein